MEPGEKKPYILIVDSDEISRQLFFAIFHKLSFEIKFCNSADQAFSEIKTRLPDLLITEIVLAGFNGFELRKRVHLLKSDMPIIFVSAVLDSASRKLVENLANDQNTFFLRKPILREPLLELVNNTLKGIYERERARHYFDQIQSDLSLASQMQQLMLPDWITVEDDGFYMTANYVPYSHLSGDYFDLIALPNKRYFFVIGDISGHGIKAALHMSVVQSLTKIFVKNSENSNLICDYLNNMNRQICADFDGVFHLTCLAAVINPAEGSIEYMSAGHPGFWLYRKGEPQLEYLAPNDQNIPIGWIASHQYLPTEITKRLFAHDTFLLALTDGVIERSRAANDFLGVEGISATAFPDDFLGLLPFHLDQLLNNRGYTEVRDDMLITALGFLQQEPHMRYRTLKAIPQSMEQGGILTRSVWVAVEKYLGDPKLAALAELVTGEFVNNIIIHAYGGRMKLTPQIMFRLGIYDDRVELLFIDRGKEWNYVPQNQSFETDITEDFYGLSQSGRGMRIIEEIVDAIQRRRIGPLNVTKFTLNVKKGGATWQK